MGADLSLDGEVSPQRNKVFFGYCSAEAVKALAGELTSKTLSRFSCSLLVWLMVSKENGVPVLCLLLARKEKRGLELKTLATFEYMLNGNY